MQSIAASTLPKRTWLATAIAALVAASIFTAAPQAQARVFLSVNIAPPMLPVYEQPEMPGAGFFWTPGYWAYGNEGGYYWVPGTWVRSPYVGALWTPGYWGYRDNGYYFNQGYWGRHVGYYGGINYGFGYGGIGYNGGYWGHGGFFYNSNYNRFGGVHITNVYSRTFNEGPRNRFSFNGPGGEQRRASREEMNFSHERHSGPIGEQVRQHEWASHNESLRASVNHGTPAIMATPRPGAEHADARSAHAAEVNRFGGERRGHDVHANAVQHSPASHQHAGIVERNNIGRHVVHESHPNPQQMEHHTQHPAMQQHLVHAQPNARHEPQERAEHRGNPGAERQPHPQGQRENPGGHGQAPRPGSAAHGGGQHQGGGKPKDHDKGG